MPKDKPSITLQDVEINDVPTGKLFQLTRELLIDGERAAKKGEYFLKTTPENLAWKIRLMFQEVFEKHPNFGFFVLRMRGLLFFIMMQDEMHDGEGRAYTEGGTDQLTTGSKSNINIHNIFAEGVQAVTKQACNLPINTPLVLDANYRILHDGKIMPASEEEAPSRPSSNIMLAALFDEMFLRKGDCIALTEHNGGLVIVGIDDNQNPIPIARDNELCVCVCEMSKNDGSQNSLREEDEGSASTSTSPIVYQKPRHALVAPHSPTSLLN